MNSSNVLRYVDVLYPRSLLDALQGRTEFTLEAERLAVEFLRKQDPEVYVVKLYEAIARLNCIELTLAVINRSLLQSFDVGDHITIYYDKIKPFKFEGLRYIDPDVEVQEDPIESHFARVEKLTSRPPSISQLGDGERRRIRSHLVDLGYTLNDDVDELQRYIDGCGSYESQLIARLALLLLAIGDVGMPESNLSRGDDVL